MRIVPIKGSVNYSITDTGRVFRGDKELKKNTRYTGYKFVTLKMEVGERQRFTVHRLVALHFILNPDNKPFVNHKNLIKDDNRVENLEWVTPKENIQHAHDNGAFRYEGVHYHAKYSDELIHKLCSLMQEGRRNKDICALLNVPKYLPEDIRAERTWRHISEQYVLVKARTRRFSNQTAKWVCEMILKNKTPKEIQELSKGKVPVSTIKDIKQKKSYRDISVAYF